MKNLFYRGRQTEKHLIILSKNELLKAKFTYVVFMHDEIMIEGVWVPSRFCQEEIWALYLTVGLIMLSVQFGLF